MTQPITCWQCDTEYDHNQHTHCPLCETHWTEGLQKRLIPPPVSGARLRVIIDHTKGAIKALPALLLALLLILSSCSRHVCPTYALNDESDSLATAPDRFSNAEKTGAVLFVLFAVWATNDSKD